MSTSKVTYAQHNYTSVNLLGITFSELRSCVKVEVDVLALTKRNRLDRSRKKKKKKKKSTTTAKGTPAFRLYSAELDVGVVRKHIDLLKSLRVFCCCAFVVVAFCFGAIQTFNQAYNRHLSVT